MVYFIYRSILIITIKAVMTVSSMAVSFILFIFVFLGLLIIFNDNEVQY